MRTSRSSVDGRSPGACQDSQRRADRRRLNRGPIHGRRCRRTLWLTLPSDASREMRCSGWEPSTPAGTWVEGPVWLVRTCSRTSDLNGRASRDGPALGNEPRRRRAGHALLLVVPDQSGDSRQCPNGAPSRRAGRPGRSLALGLPSLRRQPCRRSCIRSTAPAIGLPRLANAPKDGCR